MTNGGPKLFHLISSILTLALVAYLNMMSQIQEIMERLLIRMFCEMLNRLVG